MNPNEIMFGNLLLWQDAEEMKSEIIAVTGCFPLSDDKLDDPHNTMVNFKDGACILDELVPIQITAAWAMKNCNNHTHYHDGLIIYEFGPFQVYAQGNSVWVANGLNEMYPKYKHIKHIHKLQNLYMALMDEPLKIKE